MNELTLIHGVHSELNAWLKLSEFDFPDQNVPSKPGINSCAYFVLLFAQLERIIDKVFEELFGTANEYSFAHRVNLVGEMNQAVKILDYYSVRCEIAHGYSLSGLPLSLDEAYDFFSKCAVDLGFT